MSVLLQEVPERLGARGSSRLGATRTGRTSLVLTMMILAGMSWTASPRAWGQGVGASTSAGVSGGNGGPIEAVGSASHQGELGHSRVSTRVNPNGTALSSAGALGVNRDGSVALSKSYVFRAADGTLVGGDFQLGLDSSGQGRVNMGHGVVPGGHPGGGGSLTLGGSVAQTGDGWTGSNRAEATRDDRFGPGRGPVRVETQTRTIGSPEGPAVRNFPGRPRVLPSQGPGPVPQRFVTRHGYGPTRGGFAPPSPAPIRRW